MLKYPGPGPSSRTVSPSWRLKRSRVCLTGINHLRAGTSRDAALLAGKTVRAYRSRNQTMMATVPKTSQQPRKAPPEKRPDRKDQLRRDRMLAIVILIIFAALMGMMIWLASFGDVSEGVNYDYWMMP